MDFNFVLSQIFAVLMYFFLILSYQAKNRRNILILATIGIVFNALEFIFLSAWTGVAMIAIAFFRNFYSFWDYKKHGDSKEITKRDVVALIITITAIVCSTIPTYDGFLSLMSVFGTTLYSISVWQKNPLVYKFFGIPVGILWTIYNISIGSIFGIILELVLLVFAIVGYINALKGKKKNGRRKKH